MSERLYALGDIGATNLRIGVYDGQSDCIGLINTNTEPNNYIGAVETIADSIETLASEIGVVVAASIAVAAEVSESGVLTKSGGLHPWIGKNLGKDIGTALNLSEGLVGTPNDVVAIALSQQDINLRNNRPLRGIATTLSSGWGGALYWESVTTKSDEPGHEFLRPGGTCTCGQEGHAEAFISGGGVKINHGFTMEEWLNGTAGASHQLVADLSLATIAMIKRHETSDYGFEPEEIRWTGGVALGQSFIMQRVANIVRDTYPSLTFDTITMGEHAGLHGTFIDARRRASEY